ncbi:MAG: DUF2330 domain-containing protein [Tepidisphaeraceae bacterium]
MLSVLAKHPALDFIARSFASTLRMTVCGHDEVHGRAVTSEAAYDGTLTTAPAIYISPQRDTLSGMKLTRWIIAAVVVLGMGVAALGNGVKFPQIGFAKMPEIPQQRALIACKDGIETLVVESAYLTDSPEVGWVLPVPAEPLEISVADRDVLKSVAMCMRPEVVHDFGQKLDDSWMFFAIVGSICLAVIFSKPVKTRESFLVKLFVTLGIIALFISILLPSLGPSGPAQGQVGASAISIQRVGNYDVTALKSASADALQAWLKEQGLAAIPAAGMPLVADYSKQGWVFLVAKLARHGDGAAAAHPLAVKFPARQAVFPMRLTALAGTTTQVDLYVAAAGQAEATGFSLNSVDRYQAMADTPDSATDVVVTAHYEAGKTKLAIGSPDAAQWLWPNCIVTHLSARLQPADMGKDVWLSISPMVEPYRQTVYSEQGRRQSALIDLALGGCVVAIAMAFICRHHRRPRNQEVMAAVVIAVATFAWAGYDWLRHPVVPLVMDPDNAGRPLAFSRPAMRTWQADREILRKLETQPTTRPDQVRANVTQVIADRDFGKWTVNPLTGRLMTEERTPGNYAVREIDGKTVLCLYDLEGREQRIELGQKSSN